MFKTNLSGLLCDLVDEFLDRKTSPTWNNGTITKRGIIYEVNCRVDDWNSEDRKTAYKSFYVMFCGNTSVFYAMKKMSIYDPLQIPYENWENTSNHDSCWRSDGLQFINSMYFDMCKEVNPEKAPIELDSHAEISKIRPLKVFVTYKHNDDTWKNKIEKIERENGAFK